MEIVTIPFKIAVIEYFFKVFHCFYVTRKFACFLKHSTGITLSYVLCKKIISIIFDTQIVQWITHSICLDKSTLSRCTQSSLCYWIYQRLLTQREQTLWAHSKILSWHCHIQTTYDIDETYTLGSFKHNEKRYTSQSCRLQKFLEDYPRFVYCKKSCFLLCPCDKSTCVQLKLQNENITLKINPDHTVAVIS